MSNSSVSAPRFADKISMQHRLFNELSAMFGREVPLYDKSLLVNHICNKSVGALLGLLHGGFNLSDEQLDKTSGERHGAIRIGTAEEYRWVAGFFAAFGLAPHNFYDMTSLGSKSQPIIATAFRSPLNPEHRVFCSLLMIDNLDPAIQGRVREQLSRRQVFSEKAQALITKNEEQGGLDEAELEELVHEGTSRIFKWTAQAHDYQLYKELCDAGFKIAADIACFESHHLNHLTPNTFCMDLYTSAMKYCLGESDRETFVHRAVNALNWVRLNGDRDYMKLHFRHLSLDDIAQFTPQTVSDEELARLADQLASRLGESDLDLTKLNHAGFKDFTEGPPANTPILLRQDSYKALTEPVKFHERDGSTVDSTHTARFGEIEQRFYATTPAGRKLYDECLTAAEAARSKNPALAKQDYDAYQAAYANEFAPLPDNLPDLLRQNLVYGKYSVTAKGLEQGASVSTVDINELVDAGLVDYEGLRYEDFLPFSAAGIFASNLGQYGTKSNAVEKATYSQATLEKIMEREIVDPNIIYHGLESESILSVYQKLGLTEKLPEQGLRELEDSVSASQAILSRY